MSAGDPLVIAGTEKQIKVERFGHEHRPDMHTPRNGTVELEVYHTERRAGNRFDRLPQHQAIELRSHRRGVWIYRATTFAIDPWDVLAYVGDLAGADAVRASNEFLATVDQGFESHEEGARL